MTEPNDPIRDLVRRAHEEDPGRSEFDTDAGLADLRARTRTPAPHNQYSGGTYPAAMHRTIMTVDIAGYNNPSRTTAHRVAVHEGFWRILRGTFADTGIPWDACFIENTGDGAAILIPPEVAKADLISTLPGRLSAELRRHNAIHGNEARIQLRLAVHSGEVYTSDHGSVSGAVAFTFRMLDAPEAKSAQKETGASLALLASNSFYSDVVSHEPAASPDEFRQIDVKAKGESTTAWLRLLDDPEAGSAISTEEKSDSVALVELVNALLAIPEVRNTESRHLLLSMPSFGHIADSVPYHHEDRLHVIALVRTAQRFDHGLVDLLAEIRTLAPESLEVERLAELVSAYSDPKYNKADRDTH